MYPSGNNYKIDEAQMSTTEQDGARMQTVLGIWFEVHPHHTNMCKKNLAVHPSRQGKTRLVNIPLIAVSIHLHLNRPTTIIVIVIITGTCLHSMSSSSVLYRTQNPHLCVCRVLMFNFLNSIRHPLNSCCSILQSVLFCANCAGKWRDDELISGWNVIM